MPYSTASLGFARWVNVLNGGLVADDKTRNELALAKLMRESPSNSTFFFPAAYAPYLFGPLPEEYNTYPLNPGEAGIPVAINCDSYGAKIRGEDMHASTIKLLPGTAGIYLAGGITAGTPTLDNFTIQGPGWGVLGDGKNEAGEWSQEHKHYRYGGIIANSQFLMHQVLVRGCSGDALTIVGFKNLIPTGIPLHFTGKLERWSQSPLYYRLRPNETTHDLNKLRIGWQATAQGISTNIPFNFQDGYIYLNARPDMVLGEETEIAVRPEGGKMIADCSTVTSCFFFDNAGCGAYIQGDDGNQTRFRDCHFLGNGWMAYDDCAFLSTHFSGNQVATNGVNFNKWKGKDGWEGEDEKRVPAFRAGANESSSSTVFQEYTEADQGKGWLGPRTICIGGEHAADLEGPGSWWLAGEMNRLTVGPVRLDKAGLALRRGDDTQPLTHAFTREGLPGFSFGPHPVLQFVRPGDQYQGVVARQGAIVAPEYRLAGGSAILSAATLQEHLATLGERPARTGQLLILSEPTNGPQSYLCRVGGDADACLFEPQGMGRGSLADRPDPATLTRHDVGYDWFSPATGTKTAFVGTEWAAPAAPALDPPTKEFIPDSSPLVGYSKDDWQHHLNGDFRTGDAVTRAPTEGPGIIEHVFTSQGQADEYIARYLVINDKHLFAVFLNDEKVLERTEPGPAVASFGTRIIQHFVPTQFWNGEPELYPAFVLQPAAGVNRLRIESYTPGADGQNFYDDGATRCTRGELLSAASS